jgi:hypothetical protein
MEEAARVREQVCDRLGLLCEHAYTDRTVAVVHHHDAPT